MNVHVAIFLTVVSISELLFLRGQSRGGSGFPLLAVAQAESFEDARTWKALAELSTEEKSRLNLTEQTPHDPNIFYLPAEPYPFQPLFSADEMGYRLREFTQRPRQSCALANLFGSITSEGFLLGKGMNIAPSTYPSPGGVEVQLTTKPEEEIYRYCTLDMFPPESQGVQNLLITYHSVSPREGRAVV